MQAQFENYTILGEQFPLPHIDSENATKENILMNATLLFAKKGYAAVSMRELADICGIKSASLYNHYASKEVLWTEVLDHAKELYLLYFQQLEQVLASAKTFDEVLETIFREPREMANIFTCYAFSMIQAEQFRDEAAGDAFSGILINYSVDFIKERFDKCVEMGMVNPFDTRTVASLIMHSVLIGMNMKVQECLGRVTHFDSERLFSDLHHFISRAVEKNC